MVNGCNEKIWEEKDFGSICHVQNGYAFKSELFIENAIPIIKIANIKDGKVIIDPMSSYPEIGLDENFWVNEGDILLAMSGATTGKVGVYCERRRAYLNQRVCKMVLKDRETCYYPFLEYILTSDSFYEQLRSCLATGAQPNLSPKQVQEMIFLIPKYEEQKAITTALSDIDELISNLEKLIEKKKNIKHGVMQELLTGKKRLPGFHDSWSERRIGSLLSFGHGKDYKNLQHGDIPVYGTGGYMTSVDGYLYDGATVCIGRKGTIDVPQYHEGKIWTVDTLFYTHSFCDAIPKYMYYAFWMIDWNSYNAASGVPSLTSKTIEEIEILIPDVNEQQAIADVLTDMDEEISLLEEKYEKTIMLKQGMMQKLLTGEIRLV